jgi:hypothetical protein
VIPPGKWEKRQGCRGIVSYVFDDNLHAVVREDILDRQVPVAVFVYNREVSRHESIMEAQREALKHFAGIGERNELAAGRCRGSSSTALLINKAKPSNPTSVERATSPPPRPSSVRLSSATASRE